MSFEQVPVISVTNLSKTYLIYEKPIDRLKQFVLPKLYRLIGQTGKKFYREFSALEPMSFHVNRGETVGIIGRNGAGKSTLLQIICGTLAPSSGSVRINGRVAALLELGSGFSADFTGRENIRLNATVLGLTEAQIDERFDDIVAFADIGDFLDQPVKTYSTGMVVRLAFAVIVHVDADILVVDEALAVGDMYFQAKCMIHMRKLMDAGVTVVFVSHDAGSVKTLCNKAIYLKAGRLVAQGATDEVVEAYFNAWAKPDDPATAQSSDVSALGVATIRSAKEHDLPALLQEKIAEFDKRASFHRVQNGLAKWLDVALFDDRGNETRIVDFGQRVCLRMYFQAVTPLISLGAAYHLRDKNGSDIVYSDTAIEKADLKDFMAGEIVHLDWWFDVNLHEGEYTVAAMLSIPKDLSVGDVDVCDFVPIALNFQVSRGNSLPIYGAVSWPNTLKITRSATKSS